MLQKWKYIIANWINCYFNESEKREDGVTLESLLSIISHLRENLSLDESTSSILQANTVEEFVREKYPDFRFNNGSVDASSEDEIYMVASLLLYFVCVNSKDLDIKHAMCSQLSREDQEIILKFSKNLMECTPVTFKDVQAAITEACGQESSIASTSRLVSETPPALRSLHGEVRRLQAALDAERFDRNYLQEELARTNLRVEKLVKDKEQYKLEIVNLKAKISMCCGQERDARAGDAASEGSAKLMRDLEETEERLVQTQGLLDDAQYERDTYKAKINELKQERDKWVAVSQQEAARASQLCDELEAARCQAAALSELVAELRQHQQRSALDGSQLECDDHDAIAREHNASICSEACANVIEVQLGEERAKIVVLKQQIESLQDQLHDLTQKYETEKQILEEVVSERENEIFNLKHRINEEIEEKNNMTIHYSDAMSKLNNEINEVEQKLKDSNQQSRIVVEMKMQEIQTLQEEKLSLLQSLTDETNKLENIIKNLKSELDTEKSSKSKMREDYENHIMKLNEKVLNRNNELVELQNDVFEKSDKIEALYLELRKEKQARDELVAKHSDESERMKEKLIESENTIKLKCEDIARLTERLNYNFEFIKELGCEVDELKYAVSEQSEKCKVLEQNKIAILEELQIKENKFKELQKHLETMENFYIEEKDRLGKDLDEAAARIDTLQMQVHGELQFKIGLQDDYVQLERSKILMSKEIEQLKEEVNILQKELRHKDKTIEGMDLFLQEEKRINDRVKQECQDLTEKIKIQFEEVAVKNNEIKATEDKLIEARQKFEDELRKKQENIETTNQKLLNVIEEKKALEVKLDHTIKKKDAFSDELRKKVCEILKLQEKNKEIIEDNEKSSQALYLELKIEKEARYNLVAKHEDDCTQMTEKLLESKNTIKLKSEEISSLTQKLEELNREVVELQNTVSEKSENSKLLEETKTKLLKELQNKDRQLEMLHKHLETIQITHSEEKDILEKELTEAAAKVDVFKVQLDRELQIIFGLQNDCAQLEHAKASLSEEFEILKPEVNKLQEEIQHKNKTIERIDLLFQEEKRINEKVQLECQKLNENIRKLSEEIVAKNNQIKEIENELAETRKTFEEHIRVKDDYIESVNQKLLNVVEEKGRSEIKLNHITNEKDAISNELRQKVNEILELQENINDMNQIIVNNRETSQALHLELTKEKQAKDELIVKNHNKCEEMSEKLLKSEKTIKLKCDEVARLTERIKALDRGLDDFNNVVSEQSENIRILEEMKATHLKEIQIKDKNLEELKRKFELLEHLRSEERDKFEKDLKDAAATINALETKLDRELKIKISLQDSYAQLEHVKTSLLKEVEALADEVTKLQNEIQHKDKTIEGMDQFFEEEKLANEKVKQECDELNDKIQELSEELEIKNNEINATECELAKARKTFEKELRVKHDHIESVNEKLLNVIKEKEALEIKLDQTVKERDTLSVELCGKVNEILKLQEKNYEICKLIEDNNTSSQDLLAELRKEKQTRDELVAKHHDECGQLNKKLLQTENELIMKCVEHAKLTADLQNKDTKLEELEKNIEIMKNRHSEEMDKLQKDLDEAGATVNALKMQLDGEIQTKTSLQDECAQLQNTKTTLSNEIEMLKEEINKLNNEIQHKDKSIDGLDLVLQEEKRINETVQQECRNLNEQIQKLSEYVIVKNDEINATKKELAEARKTYENELSVKNEFIESVNQKLTNVIDEKQALEIKLDHAIKEKETMSIKLSEKQSEILQLQEKTNEMGKIIDNNTKHFEEMNKEAEELKIKIDSLQTEFANKDELNNHLNHELHIKLQQNIETLEKVDVLTNQVKGLSSANDYLIQEKAELEKAADSLRKEIKEVQNENAKFKTIIEEKGTTIKELEQALKHEREQSNESRLANDNEKLNLNNKCSLLQEYQVKSERQMEEQQKDIAALQQEIKSLKAIAEMHENDIKEKCDMIKEKDEQINNINKYVAILNAEKEKSQVELESKIIEVNVLKHKLNSGNHEEVQKALRSEEWVRALGQRDKEIFAVAVSEKTGSHKSSGQYEKEYREFHHQVDNTTSDLTHSSMESIKTISDLEKIINDKNRTITTLQCDITYLKSLVADSENKLLDVNKELEVSKENCQQLAGQLKKIVHQKNEEIAELKKQVNKMSVTENRASQIIKVSAKYQAIILKRIAEIKSNTVLKELTNFGNSANGDNELRRSLNAGTVTMEDLENFLETTDKHLKRCSEKQLALQKERDRLVEVNRINESEIINLKKFLTELSVSFKTFSTVKDLYAQKFSRVVSVQRTVRREILSLDGHITDTAMCKLERGYAAVMQDLSECVMNMERWVERCIGRTISPEKIKQAFTNDEDRASFASTTFQNTGLEVQLEELENSFQKLLEEVVRAQKGEGARDAQSVTVMEVRAEYEDKLNRMKAKMKQLYQEQIAVYKEKQHTEVLALERELAKTRERLAESSRAYEEHIRALTAELWSVGEKFLTKKDEVDWLRKKQRSGSLMSLQHVHSSGLVPPPEEPSRPSDTHSLRSLPVHSNTNANKREKEGRGLHMSDEEGEVFDNRWLKELASTPRRAPAAPPRDSGVRLSELRWRNSLCPPHLKSSYPAETQFQPVLDEEDIKFSLGNTSTLAARAQRKEVGITAYKKPGPPTPSKNAGRLSATDSDLRESLRVEAEPQPSRKTSTPSRIRALFRSNKNDTAEGTPRSRRLSIFRKK